MTFLCLLLDAARALSLLHYFTEGRVRGQGGHVTEMVCGGRSCPLAA